MNLIDAVNFSLKYDLLVKSIIHVPMWSNSRMIHQLIIKAVNPLNHDVCFAKYGDRPINHVYHHYQLVHLLQPHLIRHHRVVKEDYLAKRLKSQN